MDQHNPPPHLSEDTALSVVARVRIVVFAAGLSVLPMVLAPWTEDLFNVSRGVALGLGYAILVAFLMVYMWGFIAGAKASHDQERL